MLLVGGYPPGPVVPRNATCDPELLKVLSITDEGPVWASQYTTGTVYRTPAQIRNIISGRRTPWNNPWASPRLAAAFEHDFQPTPTATLSAKPATSHTGAIAGAVGGILGLVAVLVIVTLALRICKGNWWWERGRRRSKDNAEPETATGTVMGNLNSRREIARDDDGATIVVPRTELPACSVPPPVR